MFSRGAAYSRWATVIAFILCVAEGLKLGVFSAAMPAQLAVDAAYYWQLGEQVAGGDVWMTNSPVAFRTPGYPWFIGGMQAVFGTRALAMIVVLQYLAVYLTTLATGWWVWRITHSQWLAVGALAICFLSGSRPSHASAVLTETLFTLFLTLMMLSLTRLPEALSLRRVSWTALLFGVVCLLRPAGLAIIPVWIVALWLSTSSGLTMGLRSKWKYCSLATLLFGCLLAPWICRNMILFDRPSLTVFLGRELWVSAFGPGVPAALAIPETVDTERLRQHVLSGGPFDGWNGNWLVSSRLTAAGLTDVEADDLMRVVAIQAIKNDPLRAAARAAWRSIDFWRSVYSRRMAFVEGDEQTGVTRPVTVHWNHSESQRVRDAWLNSAPESRLLVIEMTSLVGILGLVGMCCNPRTWRAGVILGTAVVLMAISTSALEYPTYRYRMVLEPLMIVAAVVGWRTLAEILRRGTRSIWNESAASN